MDKELDERLTRIENALVVVGNAQLVVLRYLPKINSLNAKDQEYLHDRSKEWSEVIEELWRGIPHDKRVQPPSR